MMMMMMMMMKPLGQHAIPAPHVYTGADKHCGDTRYTQHTVATASSSCVHGMHSAAGQAMEQSTGLGAGYMVG